MNWIEASEAIDELKRHMVTEQLIEWLQRGHDVLYVAEFAGTKHEVIE